MNSIAASGGSAHRVAESRAGSLFPRLISALILGPLALATVWAGGWVLVVVVGAAALQMLAEWHRLTGQGKIVGVRFPIKAAGLVAALVAAGLGEWPTAFGVLVVFVPLSGSTAMLPSASADAAEGPARRAALFWAAVGMLYIGVPALALLWVRAAEAGGVPVIFWLLAVVWATDTGAYAAGRSIGGPKLAPKLSPNKTWAGLIGGIAAAGVVGAVAAALSAKAPMLHLVAFSAVVSLVAEVGDLVESALKRHFGVKDAGNLIPGHGGALDRLDSLLFAAPATALLLLAMGGADTWR